MNLFEKVRERLTNFDINSFFASLTATVGTIMTTDFVQFLYATVAVSANVWTLILSNRRSKIQLDKDAYEARAKQLENEMKEVEVESAKLELAERRKQLEG